MGHLIEGYQLRHNTEKEDKGNVSFLPFAHAIIHECSLKMGDSGQIKEALSHIGGNNLGAFSYLVITKYNNGNLPEWL